LIFVKKACDPEFFLSLQALFYALQIDFTDSIHGFYGLLAISKSSKPKEAFPIGTKPHAGGTHQPGFFQKKIKERP
jgi:hypothetical protein